MRLSSLSVVAAGLLTAGSAQAAGDTERGRALARAWCQGCHVTEGRGTDAAPGLASIAERRGDDDAYLFAWLSDPHPVMPQLSLSRQEIADLIAYLQTLRE
jgi:mono/diheme cytochrome c family protein